LTAKVYIALLHSPVLDKSDRTITTAVTNMDLHDMARLAATYELGAFYVVQPLELQARLVKRLISYWHSGSGGDYNLTRKQAFERVRLRAGLSEVVEEVEAEAGERPLVVGTSARGRGGSVDYAGLRERMARGGTWLILFGTGWGIEPGFLAGNTDLVLEPIRGAGDYNHLSVRTAAAIILDRLMGDRAPGS